MGPSHPPLSTRPIPGLSTNLISNSNSASFTPKTTPCPTSLSHPPSESVTQRLQRLRLESSRHQANVQRSRLNRLPHLHHHQSNNQSESKSNSSANHRPSCSSTVSIPGYHHCFSGASASEHVPSRPASSFLITAGPPPPASWSKPTGSAVIDDLSAPVLPSTVRPGTSGPPNLAYRQSVRATAQRVHPTPSPPSPGGLSLLDTCLRCLAMDMSSVGAGIYLAAVHTLSERHKERLLALAAEWCPLDDVSFDALLVPPERTVVQPDEGHGDGDGDGGGWETVAPAAALCAGLGALELSFTTVPLGALRRWLFAPDPRSEPGALLATRLVSLTLDHTPAMSLSSALLGLLARLPLAYLSLASQTLAPQLSPAAALSRLATATPGLESLNLSLNFHWLGFEARRGAENRHPLETVDWERKWPKMATVALVESLLPKHMPPALRLSEKIHPHRQTCMRMLKQIVDNRISNGAGWIEFIF